MSSIFKLDVQLIRNVDGKWTYYENVYKELDTLNTWYDYVIPKTHEGGDFLFKFNSSESSSRDSIYAEIHMESR